VLVTWLRYLGGVDLELWKTDEAECYEIEGLMQCALLVVSWDRMFTWSTY